MGCNSVYNDRRLRDMNIIQNTFDNVLTLDRRPELFFYLITLLTWHSISTVESYVGRLVCCKLTADSYAEYVCHGDNSLYASRLMVD